MPRAPFTYRTSEAARFIDDWYDRTLRDWPVPTEERRVATSYGETFVLEAGDAGAEELVLLHPAGTNSALWVHLADVEALARRYHVFAIDTVGDTGRSIIKRKPHKDLYAAWLVEVFGKLGLDRPTLLGASFGAAMALTVAHEHPDSLARVVAFVPPGVVSRFRLASGLRMLGLMLFFSEKRFTDFIRYANGGRLEPGQGEQMLDWLLECSRRKIRSLIAMPRALSDAEIASMRVPCQCYLGEKDPFIKARATKRRLDRLDCKVRAELLEGVGHFLDFDFEQHVARGLAEISTG